MEGQSDVIIEKEKCISCGKCVEVCPGFLLALEDTVKIQRPGHCISCGHCAAICPADAIQVGRPAGRKHFRVRKIDKSLSPEQLLFMEKRSIRAYTEKKVSKEIIEELILAGERAPSAENNRQREYLVITEREKLKEIEQGVLKFYKNLLILVNPLLLFFIRLVNPGIYKKLKATRNSLKSLIKDQESGLDRIFRHGSTLICAAGPKKGTYTHEDCTGSQHYMMLFARTLGIDSLILGFVQYAHKVLEKQFRLPKGIRVYSVTLFGYARYRYEKEISYPAPPIHWH